MRLDVAKVKIIPIIEAALEIVRLSADAKSIVIQLNLDADDRTLIGDPTRLQQVIWNLLSNSIKFTPIGGRIEINLTYSDSHAEIAVIDTGIGISPEFLPYVFQRFRQEDLSRNRSNTGLGLGLSIVRHLVELHGGTITATSAGEGQGSTFTITLPLHNTLVVRNATEKPALIINTADSIDPSTYPSLAGLRVLIVDDEPDIRQLFQIILTDQGVEVTEATSAQEALSLIITHPGEYDILLSDVGLPGEDGYSLIRQIRQLNKKSGGQIPAAALTAYAGEAEVRAALAAGFQIHLAKPIEAKQLLSVVARLSGRMK